MWDGDDVSADVIDEFIAELARAWSSIDPDPLQRSVAQLRADLARDAPNLAAGIIDCDGARSDSELRAYVVTLSRSFPDLARGDIRRRMSAAPVAPAALGTLRSTTTSPCASRSRLFPSTTTPPRSSCRRSSASEPRCWPPWFSASSSATRVRARPSWPVRSRRSTDRSAWSPNGHLVETDRSGLVAGYPDEMAQLVGSNPGLASRFPKTIVFPDYTTDELVTIFEHAAARAGYTLAEGTAAAVRVWLDALPRGKGFGNGREARDLFEPPSPVTRRASSPSRHRPMSISSSCCRPMSPVSTPAPTGTADADPFGRSSRPAGRAK